MMRRTVEGAHTGIEGKFWSKLDDLDFADDITRPVGRVKSNRK